MALTAAGGLTSALAGYTAGKTNAHIARDNAKIATAQADETLQGGEFEAGRAQSRAARVASAARAGEAGQGVVVGAGTSGAVVQDTERAGAMDALMLKRNAARQALGYTTKATGEEIAAEMQQAQGRNAAISTFLNTGSQLWLEGDETYSGYRRGGVSFGRG